MHYQQNPTWPIDENYDTGALINPANMIKHMRTFSENETLLANLTSTYKLSDDLSAKLTLGMERSETQRNTMASKLAAGSTGGGILNNGRGVVQDLENEQDLVELTLNYNKDFGDNNLDVVAGYSYQKTSTDGRYGIGWGFAQSDLIGMAKELSNNLNSIESGLSGSYQQFGFDADGLFVNRLFPTISSNEAAGSPSGALRAAAADYFGNT